MFGQNTRHPDRNAQFQYINDTAKKLNHDFPLPELGLEGIYTSIVLKDIVARNGQADLRNDELQSHWVGVLKAQSYCVLIFP